MNLHVLGVAAVLVFSAALLIGVGEARVIADMDNAIELDSDEGSTAVRGSSEEKDISSGSSSSHPQSAVVSGSSGSGSSSSSGRPSPFEQDWIKMSLAPPAKILQTLGSPVEIACEVMGKQVPTIQWVVGQMPLSELDSLESNVISETSSSAIVRVRSVHIIDHMLSEERTYTCVGRTGGKTIYASTTVYPQADLKDLVTVRDKPFSGPRKPRIIYTEKLHMDLIGTDIVLPCKVHARPAAEVFWMRGDGKLIEQSHRFKILPSGDLYVANLKWEDMGGYKCIARNSLGKDTADTFVYPARRD